MKFNRMLGRLALVFACLLCSGLMLAQDGPDPPPDGEDEGPDAPPSAPIDSGVPVLIVVGVLTGIILLAKSGHAEKERDVHIHKQ